MPGDLWKQYWTDSPLTENPASATIAEIGQAYLSERITNPRTFKSFRTAVKYITAHLGSARLDELAARPHVLISFFRNFPEKGWSAKYVYNYRLILRAAVSYWLKSRALTLTNPVNAVFLDPGTAIRENVPSYHEYRALLETAKDASYPEYLGRLLTAGWETGLRISEILDWKWENLCLHFRTGLPYYTVLIRKQKTQRPRQIPMSQALWEMLMAFPGRSEKGSVWPVTSPPHRIFRRLFREARMPGLHFHDFRKSYKTLRKAEGWTSDITQAIQGHATASMDKYYTVFSRKHLEGHVEKLWNFDEIRQKLALEKNPKDGLTRLPASAILYWHEGKNPHRTEQLKTVGS